MIARLQAWLHAHLCPCGIDLPTDDDPDLDAVFAEAWALIAEDRYHL